MEFNRGFLRRVSHIGFAVAAVAMTLSFSSPATWAQAPTPENETLAGGKGLVLAGTAWVNAEPAPAGTVVQALVDGAVCGEGSVMSNSGSTGSSLSFNFTAAAAVDKAGCGEEGKTLSFTINGQTANERLAWDESAAASDQPKSIDISAGEPFAAYSGAYQVNGGDVVDGSVLDAVVYDPLHPEIEGTVCGSIVVGKSQTLSRANRSSYAYLVVLPQALKKGCGTQGSKVLFRIDGCVIDSADWQPGFHKLDLTKPSLCVPAPQTNGAGMSGSEGVSLPNGGSAPETAGSSQILWWLVIGAGIVLTAFSVGGLVVSMRSGRRRT